MSKAQTIETVIVHNIPTLNENIVCSSIFLIQRNRAALKLILLSKLNLHFQQFLAILPMVSPEPTYIAEIVGVPFLMLYFLSADLQLLFLSFD